MDNFNIRNARPQDCPVIAELIRGLAHYEKLDDQCQVTPELLEKCLFGDKPECYAVVGWITEEDGTEKPVSFALYFYNFSTFLARKGLYLEDIFVLPEYRHRGIGKKMMNYLAAKAVEDGCGRFDWSVLDWNQPAIDFYESIGATVMQEWRICRLTGEKLEQFAETKPAK